MKSSWDSTLGRTQYHYDTKIMDPRFDTVIRLGHVTPTWHDQLTDIIANSAPASWRTRAGYAKDTKVTNLNWAIPDNLQAIADAFGLDDCMTRIHVQHPGQVWNLHLDKLEKWNRQDPSTVARYMIQLTDWQPGHFWSYGNYLFTGWTAGDVTTFDWANVPHSTANAGHTPRVTLQVTGIITAKTTDFLSELSR